MEPHYKDWDSILVNGEYLKRIKFTQKGKEEFCSICRIQKGSYHKWGCINEKSPCGIHKFVVDCDCPIRQGEDV